MDQQRVCACCCSQRAQPTVPQVVLCPARRLTCCVPRPAGDLLKKGGNKYQVCGVAARGAGSRQEHSQSMGGGLPSIPASSQLSAGSKRSHRQMQPPLPMQVPQALQQQQFQQQHDPALPPGWW